MVVESLKKVACLVALFIPIVLQTSCSCSEEEKVERPRPTKADFIHHNRGLMWRDSLCIVKYSDSLGLVSKPTETYLWMTVRDEGEGKQIERGDRVTYSYVVQDLLGDTLYEAKKDGLRTINVGKAEDCVGIDEAMLKLRRGADATVILIPSKAFGVKGDGKNVIGRVILRYDIKVIE
ncbi:MAG: FKBP-type peptidyl-prolyl cis-trans isomerase [Bacteroidales bacterium]|nr:FKBP-type peptidyl-prolyl cis-trans isomerase [Bacteroidales bacterium]